jgi:cation transport ATPase
MPKPKNRSHRVRDFFLYIAIGVAFAALAIVLGVRQAKTGQRADLAFKWIAFALNTACVFGTSIRATRPWLKKHKLWAVLAILLLLHGTIGALVISRLERIPLIWYVPVDAAEIAFLTQAIIRAFAKARRTKRSVSGEMAITCHITH